MDFVGVVHLEAGMLVLLGAAHISFWGGESSAENSFSFPLLPEKVSRGREHTWPGFWGAFPSQLLAVLSV